jgi:lipopolysaccharide transport system permease protein
VKIEGHAEPLIGSAERRQDAALPQSSRTGLRRDLEVLAAMTEADLRARFGRGRWRVVKWLLDPFAIVGVYLLLVVFVLDRPGDAPGLSLACAVIPFQLIMMSIVSSLGSLTNRTSIILNMPFRQTLVPVSAVTTEAAAFAASLGLLGVMMGAYRIEPTLAIAWLPLVIATTLLLAVALAYPAALFGLWFVELRPFAVSFVRATFFLAPGLVPLAVISDTVSDVIKANPLTGIFELYRDVLLYGRSPAPWQFLVPIGFAAAILAIFVPVYRREEGHFAKMLG